MSDEPHPEKIEHRFRMSLEVAAEMAGGDWARRIDHVELIPPTPQDWADYYDAVDHLEKARDYHGFVEDCSCEHAYIEEPRPREVVYYAETRREWMDRVRDKAYAGHALRFEPFKFDQSIVDYYFGEGGGVSSIHRYDHLRALTAARLAWTEKGSDPRRHEEMRKQVRKQMPLLARALDRAEKDAALHTVPPRGGF